MGTGENLQAPDTARRLQTALHAKAKGAGRGRVAGETGAGAAGEAGGEIPPLGHTVHPGPGGADGGDASAIADLRSGPATGAVCLPGRP